MTSRTPSLPVVSNASISTAKPRVPTQAAHPYAAFLQSVQKPARYVGGEYQQVRKNPDEVDARVCLSFPDVYDVGMSHLGTKILYSVLNKNPRIACERAFAPWVDMEAELRKRKLPLISLESASPLGDFDVLGFSLQYELTYSNVLMMMDLAGVPILARSGPRQKLICETKPPLPVATPAT